MPLLKIPKPGGLREREVTPEELFLDRRRFLETLGVAGIGGLAALAGLGGAADAIAQAGSAKPEAPSNRSPYPAPRNPKFDLNEQLTNEAVAARFNNFYEFSEQKEQVNRLVDRFQTRPWQLEVTGLVDKPRKFDVDELVGQMPLEERIYRFRCVEAWAMVVPWTGFPFRELIKLVQPKSTAKFVRMVSFLRSDQAPGQKAATWYPWPYFEGLTMAEAMNELTLLVTGIYGHELPKQHGAPIRLIVPWKYGYKSIKSIVRIEFTAKQPPTFWNTVAPNEYDFWSNVNPNRPHPRWSQATERLIDTGERKSTVLYNGYSSFVAHLYG